MGEGLINSAAFYADLLDHCQDLLDQNYHRLTRVIRPQLFYGWLRTKGAFTQADQEEVENRFVTNCMKAGCMIDIISTKGRSGFTAFLEVVEYEYGDLFSEITGKQPRTPPREFTPIIRIDSTRRQFATDSRRPRFRNSTDILEMVGELTCSLTKQIASKSDELRRLNNLVSDMQTERDQEAEENSVMYTDLNLSRETIEELKQEIAQAAKRYRQMKDERDKLQDECSLLRKQKDHFMDKCNRLHSEKLAVSLKAHGESKFQKTTEFVSLKEKVNKPSPSSKAQTSDVDKVLHAAKDEMKRLKEVLKEYQAKELQWADEREQLEETLSNAKCYQENSEQLQLSMDQIKDERDKALKECEELTKKNVEMTRRNEQLSEECRRYQEQFKRMEEKIAHLKHEINERNRQSNRLLNRAKLLQNRDDFDNPPVVLRDPSSKPETDLVHSPLRRAMPHLPFADVKEKRKASYMSAFPLVVFAPDAVQQQLFDFLLQTNCFDECYTDDANRRTSADNSEVICKKKLPDGRTYNVTIDHLKKCLAQSKTAVLMPTMQTAAVASMHKHGIEPLVVVIKLKNEFDCTELSAVEESLDHHGRGHYETVLVPESLADDVQRFSQQVLNELCRLVNKYSFLIGLSCSEYAAAK